MIPEFLKRLALVVLSGMSVVPGARAEEVKDFCPIVPFDERGRLTQTCQKTLYAADIESTRFNECFRILDLDGVRIGRCDSKVNRYIPDLNSVEPSIMVLRSDGTPRGKIPLKKSVK